ncbi:MAG TPA: hypothetical protein VGC93_13400 [Thermoanaerobaculia bacterium]
MVFASRSPIGLLLTLGFLGLTVAAFAQGPACEGSATVTHPAVGGVIAVTARTLDATACTAQLNCPGGAACEERTVGRRTWCGCAHQPEPKKCHLAVVAPAAVGGVAAVECKEECKPVLVEVGRQKVQRGRICCPTRQAGAAANQSRCICECKVPVKGPRDIIASSCPEAVSAADVAAGIPANTCGS